MTFIVYEPLSGENNTFTDAKVIDFVEAESYSYIKHRYSIGTFTLVVPNSVNGLEQIKPDMLLLVLDEYVDDSLIITSVKDDGLHTTIKGYDCKLMLKWRITLFPQEEIEAGTYGYDVSTGNTGQIIKHYIEYNAGTEAATERQIYGLVCGDMAAGISEDTYMSRMQPLNEVVEALCENADIGYSVDIVRTGETIGYVVTTFSGTNRTNGQTDNPKVVFADYTFNANSIVAETNTDARKNLIWAINGGTVDDATVTAVNNSDDEQQPAGFLRRETVTTVNCETEDVELYAKKDADGYTDKTEIIVEAGIYSDYGTRYFVGDLVTAVKNGVLYDKRILSAEKSYSGQQKRVILTLGDIPEKRVIEHLNYETSKNKSENITQRLDGSSGGGGSNKNSHDYYGSQDPTLDPDNNIVEGDIWIKYTEDKFIEAIYRYELLVEAQETNTTTATSTMPWYIKARYVKRGEELFPDGVEYIQTMPQAETIDVSHPPVYGWVLVCKVSHDFDELLKKFSERLMITNGQYE